MGPKPFLRLAVSRDVNRHELPSDLARFYADNEAIAFEGSDYGSIYLRPLREVKRVGWAGLGLLWDAPAGWGTFDACLFGFGCHFERIVYVVDAPCCQPGAILAIGGQLDWGPGGTGPRSANACLVLGANLSEWLRHLEEEDWWEYAIGFGIPSLPVEHQRELRAYYLALNPNIEWPEP